MNDKQRRYAQQQTQRLAPGAPEEPEMDAPVNENPEEAAARVRANEASIAADSAARTLESANQNINPYNGTALRFAHQVAPRKRVDSVLGGPLLSGAEVRPEWLRGGTDELTALVRKGVVLRAAPIGVTHAETRPALRIF